MSENSLSVSRSNFTLATAPKAIEDRGVYIGQYTFNRSGGGAPLVTDVYVARDGARQNFVKLENGQIVRTGETKIGLMTFINDGIELMRSYGLEEKPGEITPSSSSIGLDYYGPKKPEVLAQLEGISPPDAAGSAFKNITEFFKNMVEQGKNLAGDVAKKLPHHP